MTLKDEILTADVKPDFGVSYSKEDILLPSKRQHHASQASPAEPALPLVTQPSAHRPESQRLATRPIYHYRPCNSTSSGLRFSNDPNESDDDNPSEGFKSHLASADIGTHESSLPVSQFESVGRFGSVANQPFGTRTARTGTNLVCPK
uniref:Uncharacterized protein n=1 Tax=Anopheles farauti TaxID=69004 RepID=A0A182QMY2_9DIPT